VQQDVQQKLTTRQDRDSDFPASKGASTPLHSVSSPRLAST
jgi:hypothetical protein